MPLLRFKSKQKSDEPPPLVALFEQLEGPLLSYAYRIVADSDLAQDIVQEAFIRLHKAGTTIESPKAWLYRTVHNLGINSSKRRSREISYESIAAPDSPNGGGQIPFSEDALPNAELERNEMIGLARLLVEELDPRSRAVVELKFHEGLDYKQISERLDITVSNVGYILHHAVKSLATQFQQWEVRK